MNQIKFVFPEKKNVAQNTQASSTGAVPKIVAPLAPKSTTENLNNKTTGDAESKSFKKTDAMDKLQLNAEVTAINIKLTTFY